MNLFESLLFEPRADLLQISKYIVIVMSLLFVPYISILFGSAVLSLGFSIRGKYEEVPLFTTFSKDMVDRLFGGWGSAIIMGILPVVTMLFCFSIMLYGTTAHISKYVFVLLINTVIAVVVTFLYKKSFENRENNFTMHGLLGLAAIGGLKATFFIFAMVLTIILFPERWNFLSGPLPFPFDWSIIARFSHFMMASFAITGAAIIFFFFNWDGGKKGMDAEYSEYVRKFGNGVAIGMSIVSTLFLLWYFVTLPVMSKSYGFFISGMIGIFTLLIVCFYAYANLRDSNSAHGSKLFGFFLLFFFVILVNDNIARENTLLYQNYALQIMHNENAAKIDASRTERGGAIASLELGQEIYNAKCVACHQFDSKLVGPPYNSVLPKYNGDLQKLRGFILNPVRVNEEYIAMPNQGLKPHEAESAAMYILKKYEEEYKNK